jgi:phosphoheptose isomerase
MDISYYLEHLKSNLDIYQSAEFLSACKLIESCHSRKGWVFLGGNGGSQSIVEHFATDWNKGIYEVTGVPLKSIVMNSSSSTLTALSNDQHYDFTLSNVLMSHGTTNDLLLLVSSSGSSQNIINAYNKAKEMGIKIIALSGFGNKSMINDATVSINIDCFDYQVIEDVHSVFGHLILKYFASKKL